MDKAAQKSLERMQQIADQPRSLEESLKRRNELYETNSYHPQVKPAEAPEDED